MLEMLLFFACILFAIFLGVCFFAGLSFKGFASIEDGESRIEIFMRRMPTYNLGKWLASPAKEGKAQESDS